MALTQPQVQIIKASIPFLEQHAVDLTTAMYKYMLSTYPEVRPFFNKSHQITKRQPKILGFALTQYAKNIEDLTPLMPFVRQIVEKHVGLQVYPEQYNIVGTCLLKTMKEQLGDEIATPEFMKAWEVAYFDLANALIGLEKARYDEELKIDNAWLGFKEAVVDKVVDEAENVKSVYIKVNDDKYADFYPGQYITLRLSTDGGETIQSREYSLSNEYTDLKDGLKYYRISIRRVPDGVVSNYVHDHLKAGTEIKVSAPYGKLLEPYFKQLKAEPNQPKKPKTFFIAGIGITPSISSIEFFLSRGDPVKLLLSNHCLKSRAFGEWLNRLVTNFKDTFTVDEFVSELNAELPEAPNHKVHERRLSIDDLSFLENNAKEHDYYLIGPSPYMHLISSKLTGLGVDPNAINSEEYGPVSVDA